MERSSFRGLLLPLALLLPQLAVTFVFFYWPAVQALWQSLLLEDAFGLNSSFVGLENYRTLFADPISTPSASPPCFLALSPCCRCRSRSCSR